jgi:adenylate cyclase class IV
MQSNMGMKINKYKNYNKNKFIKFFINDRAGLGQFITIGTQILLQLSFCDDTYEQLRILDDVINKLGIEPEDFNRIRRNDIKASKFIENQDESYSFE